MSSPEIQKLIAIIRQVVIVAVIITTTCLADKSHDGQGSKSVKVSR